MARLPSDPTVENPTVSKIFQLPSIPLGISVRFSSLPHSQPLNTSFASHIVLSLFSSGAIQQIPVDRGVEPFPFILPPIPPTSILRTVLLRRSDHLQDSLLAMAQELQGYRETSFFSQYQELLNSMELQDEEVKNAMAATVVQRSVVPYMNLLLQIKQEVQKAGEEMKSTFSFVENQAEAVQSKLKEISAGQDDLSRL